MLSILYRWNRWGSAKLFGGNPRQIIPKLKIFLDTPEVVTLTGLRRSGKTTLLYQLMDLLEKQGVSPEAMLHMNFEEPALGPLQNITLLDDLYRIYRETIYPEGKAYIFFDEIQNVPEWERWVRARNESENIKIFLTGSSANLMSRELGTVLTGRHVEFYIAPLNFSEFLSFKNIPINKTSPFIDAPAEIEYALKQYLKWGGLPEVVLSEQDERKIVLLRQYFDDVLFKDVALRHQIRDLNLLRNIAVHLLSQTASLISINRIAKIFAISSEMANHYCHFIQEAFLINFLPFFSLKAAERTRNPNKVHAYDLGLRFIASLSNSPDYGRLAETLVYQHLQQHTRGNLFYWKGEQEIDFAIRQENSIVALIQVAYENLDDPKIWARETNSLNVAHEKFPLAKSFLITHKLPKKQDKRIMPLWYFLLNPQIISASENSVRF